MLTYTVIITHGIDHYTITRQKTIILFELYMKIFPANNYYTFLIILKLLKFLSLKPVPGLASSVMYDTESWHKINIVCKLLCLLTVNQHNTFFPQPLQNIFLSFWIMNEYEKKSNIYLTIWVYLYYIYIKNSSIIFPEWPPDTSDRTGPAARPRGCSGSAPPTRQPLK